MLEKLQTDHPGVTFLPGVRFAWDPKSRTVHYPSQSDETSPLEWSLLHEVGHALLDHQDFESDVQLLHMEVDAWQKATELGETYGIAIDQDHVQDCLDTYRDWLHARATCPTCLERCLQKDVHTYQCHNCATQWHVTKSRLCRAYRKKGGANPSSPFRN